MKKPLLICICALALTLSCQAVPVILGEIELRGDFTLNHNYNHNRPADAPFGLFDALHVEDVRGIFDLTVNPGDSLGLMTPFVFGPSNVNGDGVASPMVWNIGGWGFNTERVLIVGARHTAIGLIDPVSFNGFELSAFDQIFSSWTFTPPVYDVANFRNDVTGLINMEIVLGYEDGTPYPTPDVGSTLLLLGMSLCVLFGVRK